MRTLSALSLAFSLVLSGCVGDKSDDDDDDDDDPVTDADGDGFDEDDDCDDDDDRVNPDADEVCDGVDNNCDGIVDEDASDATEFFTDGDGDGFGDPDAPVVACELTDGLVDNDGDCDDDDDDIHPDADEVCDGEDNDCSGKVDDNATDASTWYADDDGDGYGDPGSTEEACERPSGFVDNDDDCDDASDFINPDAVQYCYGADVDCNPDTSEEGMVTWVAEDGGAYDATPLFEGATSESPLTGAMPGPGVYYFCEGTHYLNMDLDGDYELIGLYGPDATTLSGADQGSVFRVLEGTSLSVTGLTLADGFGVTEVELKNVATATEFGGALVCLDGELNLSDVVVRDSWGFRGGGLFAHQCDVRVEGSLFSGNTGSYGAGLALGHGTLSIVDTEISDNTAEYSGGGLFLGWNSEDDDALLAELDGVVIQENDALYGAGGGLFVMEGTSASLTGGSAVVSNLAVFGGAAYLSKTYDGGAIQLSSTASDWGTDGGGDNNDPDDIYSDSQEGVIGDYGDSETFTCDRSSCW